MARPAVHPTTEELYASLGSGITSGDEATGWQLLRFLNAAGEQLGEFDDLVRDSDAGPGWSALLDVDRIDDANLAYLAQFVGAQLTPGLDPAAEREQIRVPKGWGRGTPAAIAQAAKTLLTRGQQVLMEERFGDDAYALRVRTYAVETPDPSAVQAALLAAKPAGIALTYAAIGGGTYEELGDAFPGDYTALDADFGTYADQTSWTP